MTPAVTDSPGVLHEAHAALHGRGTELTALCVFAFLTLCSYEVARPAIESLFLARYGQAGLPWVWLSVAVAAVIVVAIYNRLAVTLPVLPLLSALRPSAWARSLSC